jgi:hypothetical protein
MCQRTVPKNSVWINNQILFCKELYFDEESYHSWIKVVTVITQNSPAIVLLFLLLPGKLCEECHASIINWLVTISTQL